MFQHQCVLACPSLSTFVSKSSQKSSSKNTLMTFALAVSKECKDAGIIPVLFFSFSLSFARPDTDSYPLPEELRGGGAVQ